MITEPTFFDDYEDVPAEDWRWQYFTPREIGFKPRTPEDRTIIVHPDALDALDSLRNAWGKPITINSAYRSPTYNDLVGGKKKSKHLKGKAFDCSMRKEDQNDFVAEARKHGFRGIGWYNTFVHIDTRDVPAEWRVP